MDQQTLATEGRAYAHQIIQAEVDRTLAEVGQYLDERAWRDGDTALRDHVALERARGYLERRQPHRAALVLAGHAGYALRFAIPATRGGGTL